MRGIFYETAWSRSAARGILQKAKVPVTDPNVMRVIQRRLDFTEDEWSYFALEYLREQQIFSIIPMIVQTNKIWRACESCQDTFHFNIPSICYGCRDSNRKIVTESKERNP